ncbi:putative CAP domain-containing protein [Dioscorea sansibarensis]
MGNHRYLVLLLLHLTLLSSPILSTLALPIPSIPSHLPRPLIAATVALISGKKTTPRAFLKAHNLIRANFSEQPLIWDRKLARNARRWSLNLKYNFECTLSHSAGPFGENLFWGSPGWQWTPNDAVESWAKEASDYDWANNICAAGKVCGHFTQIIWNDTQKIGCGRADCPGRGVVYTCNYDPPGNWLGERPLTN